MKGDCTSSICTCGSKQAILESCSWTADLAVVVSSLHFKDVRDDAVNGHVSDKPSEEKLFSYTGAHQTKCWKTHQGPCQSANPIRRSN